MERKNNPETNNERSDAMRDFEELSFEDRYEERRREALERERERMMREGATGNFKRIEGEVAKADEKDLPWYKRTVFRKIRYAIIAVLIALTLWGYVLMSENPVRIKRVENVRLTFAGGNEADLKSRDLIISGDIDQILSNVEVFVRTTLNDLPRFDKAVGDIVTATVSLGDIREPGTYTRRIVATSAIGTVDSVEPSTITITVEKLLKRTIPVTCVLEGELPEGYWHDEPKLVSSTIEISGAESNISNITSAVCSIDLTGRTKRITESFTCKLLDSDGNEVDSSVVVDTVPSASVRMEILPCIDLPLDQYIETVGSLSADYEIGSITVKPAYLSIAAQKSVLDSIPDSVYIEPINISNFTEAGVYTQKASLIGLPSDITLLSDNNFIITVEVVDKTTTRILTVRISENVIGEDNAAHNYQYSSTYCTVEISGPARLIKGINASDLLLVLDVSGYTSGTHEIKPTLSFETEPEWYSDSSTVINISSVICTITPASNP